MENASRRAEIRALCHRLSTFLPDVLRANCIHVCIGAYTIGLTVQMGGWTVHPVDYDMSKPTRMTVDRG